MRRGALLAALSLAAVATHAQAAAEPHADPDKNKQVDRALAAALTPDGSHDIVLIEQPSRPGAPRVRAATLVGAPPAAVKAVLLDAHRYRAIIPGLVRMDVSKAQDGATALAWELEIPMFNMKGRLTIRDRPDGVELNLVDGDLSPGRIVFTIAPHPSGRTALTVDAQLDVTNSTWLLRRIMSRSPVGEPAALAAATYVALRAAALRAEHADSPRAWRPYAPPSPPPTWLPDSRPLVSAALAPLRARGAVGLVARSGTQRLGGVAMAVTVRPPPPAVAARLRDPAAWGAFPGWSTVRTIYGPNGPGAQVEDSLPLADFDATWVPEPGNAARWSVSEGVTRGARLGWDVFQMPDGGQTVATLLLYPRLETTGRIARKSIASEPLMEHGLALALAFANATGVKTALDKR
jgi:hypothetical protein